MSSEKSLTLILNRLRRPLILFGALLLTIDLLADPLGISSAGISRGQVLMGLVALLLIVIGSLGERVVEVYQKLGLLLLNTLVMLLILEISAGIVSWVISDEPPQEEVLDSNVRDWRSLPYYASQDWAEDYWAEAANQETVYKPFVIWRSAPQNGDYINTDEEGLRLTPDLACGEFDYKVFAYGGSTMWGAGSPDRMTIPEYLGQGLIHALRMGVCVVNFGQTAYVSTQNVIDLMLRLQVGDVPDLVIFYNGINEVQAAYETGSATSNQNYSVINHLFENLTPQTVPLGEQLSEELRDKTYSGRLFDRYFGDDLNAVVRDEPAQTYAKLGVDPATLAQQVAAVYYGNYRLVETLAQGYGFDFYFFWQPVLALSDKPLTPEEQPLRDGLDPDLVTLYQAVYDRVAMFARQYDHFFDIRDALDTTTEQLYIDEFHITPVGNNIIASRMVEVIMSHIQQ